MLGGLLKRRSADSSEAQTSPAAPTVAPLDRSEQRVEHLRAVPQLPEYAGVLARGSGISEIVVLIDAHDKDRVHVLHSESQRNSIFVRKTVQMLRDEGYHVDERLRVVPIAVLQELRRAGAGTSQPSEQAAAPAKVRSEAAELRILSEILLKAIDLRASDVRFSIQFGGGLDRTLVRMRIDGTVRTFPISIDAATGAKMIAAAYATYSGAGSGNVEIWTADKRQEAYFSIPGVRGLRCRYNLIPMSDGSGGAKGPDVVLRLLSWQGRAMRFRSPIEAGFSPDQADALLKAVKAPRGLVLLVGPTGSGKTTLLATLLSQHPEVPSGLANCYAIEDPPELDVPSVRSISIRRTDKDVGEDPFVVAMRDLLRHDPDICVPGEIRDGVSCGLVSQMTLSHKVLATFHASDFLSTMLRLRSKEIGYPSSMLGATPFAGGLVAVASVGLLPRLCRFCALPAFQPDGTSPVDAADAKALESHFGVDLTRLRIQREGGCEACSHQGIQGRTAIGEVVVPDGEMSALIRSDDFHGAYHRYRSRSDGRLDSECMVGKTIFEHGLTKAIAGEVSIVDLIDKVDSPAVQAMHDQHGRGE